jgi:hypothetical protein
MEGIVLIVMATPIKRESKLGNNVITSSSLGRRLTATSLRRSMPAVRED